MAHSQVLPDFKINFLAAIKAVQTWRALRVYVTHRDYCYLRSKMKDRHCLSADKKCSFTNCKVFNH